MATPVIELIAANLLSTIAKVTEQSGYQYTLTAQRRTRAGVQRDHLNAVLIQDNPRPVKDPKVPNTNEWDQTFAVGVFIIPAEEDRTSIDTYVNIITSDVQKAVMIDRYRGGNAMDTRIVAPELVPEEALEYDMAIINVEVNWRVSELDPYVNAK